MSKTVVILCTCPDEATAGRLARGLVEKRHVACVNILPAVRSIYRWEDGIEDEQEALMIIKTTHLHGSNIEHWLAEHHPYDVPELITLDATHVSEPYRRWLNAAVSI